MMDAPGMVPVSNPVRACAAEAPRIGSLGIFWSLIEPVLARLQPQRVCEVGVESGAFTARLLAWGREHGCAYLGIDPLPDSAALGALLPPAAGGGEDGAAPPAARLLVERSLHVLPSLESCDVYFLDGDHNHHTVLHELTAISRTVDGAGDRAPRTARGPVVFVHDVGWPWGRRDMYYLPTAVPAEARQPWSETLGVALEGDALVDGGLRDPGRYAIALRAGGPRNGVLTAVEDFLAGGGSGAGWESMVFPIAYGLAILHRPAGPGLPAGCREYLRRLREVVAVGGDFLRDCEGNFLRLYLFGEHARHESALKTAALEREGAAHHATLHAYGELKDAYDALLAHSEALGSAYRGLRGAYDGLIEKYPSLPPPPRESPAPPDP